MLMPQLRAELEVSTPADRGPGSPWEMGPAIDAAALEVTTNPTRVGYACCSTAQQERQSQLDALEEAGSDLSSWRRSAPGSKCGGVRQGDGLCPHHQEGPPRTSG